MIGASPVKQIALTILAVALVIGTLSHFDLDVLIVSLLARLDELGSWAPLLFIAIDCLFVVLVLPGVLLTLGAGFLFGVVKGSAYVVVATTLGAGIAFLVARYLLGARTARFFLSHPKLQVVNREFTRKGWGLVLLTRLIPFFPFKLSNYFFGFTGFRLGDFLVGTFFGIIPITIFNVYIGSLAGDLATLGARATPRSPLQWTVYGAGFLITVVALIYINRRAQKILNDYLAENSGKTSLEEQPTVEEEKSPAANCNGGT